jgi:hypothetical protein
MLAVTMLASTTTKLELSLDFKFLKSYRSGYITSFQVSNETKTQNKHLSTITKFNFRQT